MSYKYLTPNHPNWLPTFRPILAGVILLCVWFGILYGWTLQLLVLVSLCCCTMLPLPIQLAAYTALGIVLLELVYGNLNLAVEVASIAICSTLITIFLRDIEWRLATQSVLTSLASEPGNFIPETILSQALALLKSYAGADAAIALRQLDEVTAQVVVSIPENALPDALTTPALFTKALVENRCLYYLDYQSDTEATHLLLAQKTQSLAVLPLASATGSKAAILLIWHRRTYISSHLRQLIASLLGELRTLMQFSHTTISMDKLQARFSAMLETIHQGVVIMLTKVVNRAGSIKQPPHNCN